MRFVRLATLLVGAVGTGCSDDPARPTAPSRLETLGGPAAQATVGTAVSPAPTFAARDASGSVVSGLPVTITVTEGGGTITGAPRTTTAGETSVGTWTLGQRAGRNALSVRVGSLPPLEIVIAGVPDIPNVIMAVQGDGQAALAGDELPQPLAVQVADRFANGIPGREVSFSVVAGDGVLSATTLTTDAGGIAGTVRWRLGHLGGAQRIQAVSGALTTTFNAGISTDYTLDLRFVGAPPDANVQAAFQAAVARIRATVIGDLPDVLLQGFDVSRCGVIGAPLSEVVDDVIIFATVTSIDGPGKILGSAGPCLTRTQSGFAVIGIMRFDIDDLGVLTNSGRIGAVILHEMLHVIGVGTLWRNKDLLFGSGTQDPRFSGALGALRCLDSGGTVACGDSRVPVENTGGTGTIEAHWRESVFDAELMTSIAEQNPNMPFSAITVASLEDLGLVSNYLTADPYFVPPGASLRIRPGAAPETFAPWETLEIPRYEVTSAGWERPIAWK